jgi:prolipoprotein diacylglyceryltransferase
MLSWIINNKLWLILGFGATFNSFWIIQYGKKLRIKNWLAVLLSIAHMICAVLCARLFAFMEGAPGGMSLYGGLFFLPVLFCLIAWLSKRSIIEACDVFTIPNIVTVFCARLNCVFSGCCLGTLIPGTEGLRWPTREIELALYVVLYIVLRQKIGKPAYKGKLYPIYMITYGTFRFVVEWFRESTNAVGFVHISHIWSLLAIAIGVTAICLINKNKNENKQFSKKKLKGGDLK